MLAGSEFVSTPSMLTFLSQQRSSTSSEEEEKYYQQKQQQQYELYNQEELLSYKQMESNRTCTHSLLLHDFTSESFTWREITYNEQLANEINESKEISKNSSNKHILSLWAKPKNSTGNTSEKKYEEEEESSTTLWTRLEENNIVVNNIPSGRFGHSSILYKDTIVIYGGRDRANYLSDVHLYSIPERKWINSFTPAQSEQEHSNSTNTEASLNITVNYDNTPTIDDEVLNTTTHNMMLERSSFHINRQLMWPSARCAHSAIVYKNDMYVISGNLNAHNLCASDMWKFSLTSNTWTCLEMCLPFAPRKGHSSHVLLASQTAQRSKYDMIITFGGLTCTLVSELEEEEEQEEEEEEESSSPSQEATPETQSSFEEEEEEQQQEELNFHHELEQNESLISVSDNNNNSSTINTSEQRQRNDNHLFSQHFHSHHYHNHHHRQNDNDAPHEGESIYECASNEVLLYKFKTKCWSLLTTCGEVPCGRFYHSAQIVDGTTLLLVFGGRTKINTNTDNTNNSNEEQEQVNRQGNLDERVLNDLHVLDISTGVWRNITLQSTATLYNRLHNQNNNIVEMIINSNNSKKIIVNNTTKKNKFNSSNQVAALQNKNNHFNNINTTNVLAKCHFESSHKNFWPAPRKCAASVYANGKFVILSGINDMHECCEDGYEFDCYTQQWSHFTLTRQPACSCPTVVYYKTRLLLFGGYAARENKFIHTIYELVLPHLSLRSSCLLWLRTAMLHDTLFGQNTCTKMQCDESYSSCPSSSFSLYAKKANKNDVHHETGNNNNNNNSNYSNNNKQLAMHSENEHNYNLQHAYSELVRSHTWSVEDVNNHVAPLSHSRLPFTTNTSMTSYNNDKCTETACNCNNYGSNDNNNNNNNNCRFLTSRSRSRKYCVYGNDSNFMHLAANNLTSNTYVVNSNNNNNNNNSWINNNDIAFRRNERKTHECNCGNTNVSANFNVMPTCERLGQHCTCTPQTSDHCPATFVNFGQSSTIATRRANSDNHNNNGNSSVTREEIEEHDALFTLTRAYTEPIIGNTYCNSNENNINTHNQSKYVGSNNNTNFTIASNNVCRGHWYKSQALHQPIQQLTHSERWCNYYNNNNSNNNNNNNNALLTLQSTQASQTDNFVLSRAVTENNIVTHLSREPDVTWVNNTCLHSRQSEAHVPTFMRSTSLLAPPPPYEGDTFNPFAQTRPKFPNRQLPSYNTCALLQPTQHKVNESNNYNSRTSNYCQTHDFVNNEFGLQTNELRSENEQAKVITDTNHNTCTTMHNISSKRKNITNASNAKNNSAYNESLLINATTGIFPINKSRLQRKEQLEHYEEEEEQEEDKEQELVKEESSEIIVRNANKI